MSTEPEDFTISDKDDGEILEDAVKRRLEGKCEAVLSCQLEWIENAGFSATSGTTHK
jgi:hypothetical protein